MLMPYVWFYLTFQKGQGGELGRQNLSVVYTINISVAAKLGYENLFKRKF